MECYLWAAIGTKMLILYVTLGLNPCGGVRIICEHLNRLTERGHDCYLFALNGDMSVDWMPTNFKVIGDDDLGLMARKIDIVVATEANTMQAVAKLQIEARKFNLIQMRESLFFWDTNKKWARWVEDTYRDMKDILQPIVISKWLKQFLEEEHGYENVPVVPNGVNTEMFYPDPAYPKTDRPRLLIEGHGMNEAKDLHQMAYQVVDTYRKNIQPVELWGFSQYPPAGEWDRYWLLPSQDEIRQIYSSCDVLVKASRFEGRSCVDAEAMACGCAVVRAIDTGDDDLIEGYNCLKVHYGDAQGMYDNLKLILEQPALRQRLIDNGLKYVREHLRWEPSIDLLEAIYESQ